MMHKLPELPYAYDALEPYLDAKTLHLHHLGHHRTYVKKLNEALEDFPEFQNRSVEDLLIQLSGLPSDLQEKVRAHGGGHYNHSLMWTLLHPKRPDEPRGELREGLEEAFGNLSEFHMGFCQQASELFGS